MFFRRIAICVVASSSSKVLSLVFAGSVRCLFLSRGYKSRVLPQVPNEQLKHVEWDGWGFAGAGDTTEFLVFDPADSLAGAAKNHSSGRFSGIPCEVPEVRRLESEWYTVRFYTDTV